jgi:voltage-gated potassium channel
MKPSTEDAKVREIEPLSAIREFFRVLWHLRSLMIFLSSQFVLLSVLMYYFGGPLDVESHTHATPGVTAYFCAITALTIGYGDVIPTTGAGRICAILLGLLGVLITGLITAAAVYAIQSQVLGDKANEKAK